MSELKSTKPESFKPMQNHLLETIKTHAIENYANGWDVIVECYTDAEILEVIGLCTTRNGAIKKFETIVGVTSEQRKFWSEQG